MCRFCRTSQTISEQTWLINHFDSKLSFGFYRSICNFSPLLFIPVSPNWCVNTLQHLNNFHGCLWFVLHTNHDCSVIHITSVISCWHILVSLVMPVDDERPWSKEQEASRRCCQKVRAHPVHYLTDRSTSFCIFHCYITVTSKLWCSNGYSVIMLPSSLMLSWLLLDVWVGFPFWLDIIMELSLKFVPMLLGNDKLCGRGLTTVKLCGLLLGESLLRLVLLLLVTRWESKGARQSFSRIRSPSSSSSSLSPSAMLLL